MTEVKQQTLTGETIPIPESRIEVHAYISPKAQIVKDNARFFMGKNINISKTVSSSLLIFDALRSVIPAEKLCKISEEDKERILDTITQHMIHRLFSKMNIEDISETLLDFFNQSI